MRAPKGWFEWARTAGRVVIWGLILGFISTWIYKFDRCMQEAISDHPQFGCLMSSFGDTYVTLFVRAVHWFWQLVTLLL